MGENTQVTVHTPSPGQERHQDRTGSSLSHRGLSRSMANGAPLVERDTSLTSPVVPTPMFSTPSESLDVKFSLLHDQHRTSTVPDLQYPIVAPDDDTGSSFAEQSVPPHQPSLPRNSSGPGSGDGLSNGVSDGPASPSSSTLPQRSRSLAPTELEQLRRPVEHLIKLASVREDRMSRQREIFGLRSGELSTFSLDAARATKFVQDQMELVKLQAEEMRAQADQMLQEANKTREMADRLITSVDTLTVDVPNARKHVDHLVERSEQMSSFMRKNFDWLAALRVREQEKVQAIQEELERQALAEEINRLAREQELQRQLERRKAEAQERENAARKEEEEREAAKKKAEEEEEALRKKEYEAQRAAVMAQKRRATEEQAQFIQAERERRLAEVSGSGSTAPTSVFPVASDHISNARVPTSLPLPPVAHGPTRSPAAPLSQPTPSPNNARVVQAPVFFVPAQTEVGRTVNTDSPLSSTTLASELHPRTVQPSQRPPSTHPAHTPAQDQMPRHEPRRMTPISEQRPVDIKREPSVEELPAARIQASPLRPSVDTDEARQWNVAIPQRTPSQERHGDQRNHASSRPPSQSDEHRRHSDLSVPVPPDQASLTRSRQSFHGGTAQGTDVRGHTRQDSTPSDRSPPRWNDRDRRSRSPLPRRPLSRSPSPYSRKRVRSGTPRYDSRQAPDHRKRPRSPWRSRPDWVNGSDRDRGRDRDRQFYDYDRERQGDSPRRHRPPPPRRIVDTYRPPSNSPAPPSPRRYRYSPRPGYHERSSSPEYDAQRFVGSDVQGRESERINTTARHYEPTSMEARHTVGREEQRWQRPTPSPSDRDRTPTPPPRLADPEVGLLDRINMNEAETRGRGRGRLLPGGVTRGGPNPRRGSRGGPSGGRGRGVPSASAPALLSRMTGTTTRGGIRPAVSVHAPSLSDRMEQD